MSLCGNGLIATFQLSSAASLNLGRSHNGVLGNVLIHYHTHFATVFITIINSFQSLTLSQTINFRPFLI